MGWWIARTRIAASRVTAKRARCALQRRNPSTFYCANSRPPSRRPFTNGWNSWSRRAAYRATPNKTRSMRGTHIRTRTHTRALPFLSETRSFLQSLSISRADPRPRPFDGPDWRPPVSFLRSNPTWFWPSTEHDSLTCAPFIDSLIRVTCSSSSTIWSTHHDKPSFFKVMKQFK